MRLSYIAPCRTEFPSRSASSIHMIRMCEALSELGHSVTMIISAQGAGTEEIFNYYGVSFPFNIEFVPVAASRIGNIKYSIEASKRAARCEPDFVMGRSTSACSIAALRGEKVIFDSHGPIWEANLFDRFLYKLMIKSKNLARMAVNSAALKKMYISAGYAPTCEFVVAHNGSKSVDEEIVRPLSDWPGRSGRLQVGYFGHFYPGRGIEVILECAKLRSEVDFHLVGGTKEDNLFWKERCDLENVKFHGYVAPALVASVRAKCDVLLAPYQSSGVAVTGGKGDSSLYMCPIKIIEYMASGKAIICSDLPILRELLDEECAIFAMPNHASSWSEAISQLQDDKLRATLGATALHKFSTGLTWRARAAKLLGVELASSKLAG